MQGAAGGEFSGGVEEASGGEQDGRQVVSSAPIDGRNKVRTENPNQI